LGPGSPAAAWAAPRRGTGSTPSAGAAPDQTPGMAGEEPPGHLSSRVIGDSAAMGPAGVGAGAVRDAEGSGRSNRRQIAAPAVRVELDKRVPIGAGLGGGSSDAAHTLVALDRLLGARWSTERLAQFAGSFGSDTPFFVMAALGGPSCACRGRGEVIRPVARPAARNAVVYSPPFGLSTRDVYARFDEMGLGFDAALEQGAEPDWGAWARLPARELLARLVNDLEPAAFSMSGELADLRAELERRIGRVVRMSGSGSSLFTLFDENGGREAEVAAGVGERLGAAASVVELTPAAGW